MSQTISVANLPAASTISGSETTLVVQSGATRRTTVDSMLRIGDRVAAASHTHTIANVTGLQGALDGKAAAGSVATSGLTAPAQTLVGRFDAGSGALQIITLGSGLTLDAGGVLIATGEGGGGGTAGVTSVAGLAGVVSGPALKTALAISWADVGGKPAFSTVANSGSYNDLANRPTLGTAAAAATTDFAAASHTHTIANVTGLQGALDGKAGASHTHAISDVTNLQTVLDGKANLSHAHAITDVTGLQSALDGKASAAHTHAAFAGATAGAGGAAGFVPAPAAGEQARFLRGDGTWALAGGAQLSGGNTWSGTQVYAGATLDGPQLKAHRFASANKGTVNSGTVTFTVSDAPHQRLQCGGALTLAFTGWAPSGAFSDMMLELVNGGGVNLSWPVAINWVKADGTTTTSFGSNGVTLTAGATNRDWVYLWSTDGGTTIFGKIVR